MVYRPHWSAESLTESSVSSVDWQDKLSYTFTAANQEASTDYLLLWSCDFGGSSTSYDPKVQLTAGGSSVGLFAIEAKEPSGPRDYNSVVGAYKYTAASTPADIEFKIQYTCENLTFDSYIKNARVSIFKLGSADKYGEYLSAETLNTSEWTNTSCSVTFTPDSTGDYVIVGLVEAYSVHPAMRITDGSSNSVEIKPYYSDSGTINSLVAIWPVSGLSGSKTYTIQGWRWTGSAAVQFLKQRIVVLRVDGFDNVYSTTLGSDDAGTDTGYTTALSQTFTPAATDHLTIASTGIGLNSTSYSGYVQLLDGADTVNETRREISSAGQQWPFASQRIATYTAAERIQDLQRKSEAGSLTTTIIAGAAIVTFDLGTSGGGGSPYTLTAASGSYAVSGSAASLLRSRRIAASSGAYALTGTAADFRRGKSMAGASGSYGLTGTAASFARTRVLPAASGAYALTGTAAALKRARVVAAASGSYAVTGTAAAFKRGKVIEAAAGSYAVTGTPASLAFARRLTAGSGAYSLTGTAATLTVTGVGSYTLAADSGAYALTGTAAGLLRKYILSAGAGTYALTGANVSLLFAHVMAAGSGSYTLTGSATGLKAGRLLAASTGAYTLTGAAVGLTEQKRIAAGSGAYAVTGSEASMVRGRTMPAASGAYALTGTSLDLLRSYTLAGAAGAYVLDGSSVTLTYSGQQFWTPVTPIAETWTQATAATGTWVPIGPGSTTWTPQ